MKYPRMSIASGTRFSPTSPRTLRAITYAPPDSSRKVPMMHPITITMPMELTVLPNPLLTDAMILSSGMPEHRPYPMAAMISARNGCSLSFVVEMTMKAMARMSRTISIS